jgi:hypothetical protein
MGGPTASNVVPSAELDTENHADVGPVGDQFAVESTER